jgi:hypothetical protein
MPFIKRFGRLRVIMAVDQHGRATGCALPIGVDNGVAFCRNDFDVFKTNPAQMIGKPCGASLQVLPVIGLRADGRKSHKIF